MMMIYRGISVFWNLFLNIKICLGSIYLYNIYIYIYIHHYTSILSGIYDDLYPICSMYGIFTYIWVILFGPMLVNIPYMEHLGIGIVYIMRQQSRKSLETASR